MDDFEYAKSLRAQGEMYRLLSQCMSRPTESLAGKLSVGLVPDAFDVGFGDTVDEEIKVPLGIIRSFCEENSRLSIDDFRLLLEVEYNRLFVGPGRVLAPPYESAYLGTPFSGSEEDDLRENSIDGRHLLKVRDAYRNAGFDVSGDFHDLVDKLSVELDFVSCLYLSEAFALEAKDDDKAMEMEGHRLRFVLEHLFRWVGHLSSKVEAGSRLSFYPAVMVLICKLVEFDAENA